LQRKKIVWEDVTVTGDDAPMARYEGREGRREGGNEGKERKLRVANTVLLTMLPPSLPPSLPRYGHTMTVLDSRHIAVFGGVTQNGNMTVAFGDLRILVVRREEGGREGGRERGRGERKIIISIALLQV
jgi:hypothetical protein